jgi:hypothetical protein
MTKLIDIIIIIITITIVGALDHAFCCVKSYSRMR